MTLRSVLSGTSLFGVLLLAGLPACGTDADVADQGEENALKADSKTPLSVRLSVASPGKVRYESVNNTSEPAYGKGWHPSEPGKLLSVTKDGSPVPYMGPMVMKMRDDGEWSLGPGETLVKDIDIARNFDVGEGGTFDVSTRRDGPLAAESVGAALAANASVQIVIEKQQPRANSIGVKQQALTYESCNNDQRGALSGANQGATYMLNQALSAPASRYRYWFGTPPASDVAAQDAAALNRVSEMRWLGTNANAEFICEDSRGECGANPSWLAYVWPADANAGRRRIQFCQPFWALAHDGTDAGDDFSRVGVMVHEFSHHFGTDDLGYWETAVRNLALNNWQDAYANADNFRFFVMNTGNH